MATLALSRCSIVMVGSWNRAIFSPQWVIEKVFPREEQLEVEMGFAAQPLVGFVTDRCRLQILPGQVRVFPLQAWEGMRACEDAARAVLERLPETPVRGVGINVGFDVDSPTEILRGLFELQDLGSLAQLGRLRRSAVRHYLDYAPDGNLTLSVEMQEEKQVRIDLNFHWNVHDAITGAQRIRGRSDEVLAYSHDLVQRVYEVEVQ